MKTISVSEFRANITKILKDIKMGAVINITSRGKVIAKLVPADDVVENARKKLNGISHTAILNDIVSPIDNNWVAQQQ